MQPHTSILVVVLALVASTIGEAFGGYAGGGPTTGKTVSFPGCAKSCIRIPNGNFFDQFQAFCSSFPKVDCCITKACSLDDKTHSQQVSQQICNYIGVKVPAFVCAPTLQASADKMTTSTLHPSTHSTLLSSVRSAPSITQRSTHADSSLGSSKNPSSTSSSRSASHTTLSVYNGFVGAYCYNEGTRGHALTGNSTSSASMTIETCLDFCSKEGFGWAGLMNSNECYCGTGIANGATAAADSACDLGCSGDESENCGGAKAISVYESG